MWVKSFKIAISFALLSAVTGFPSAGPPKSDSVYPNDVSLLVGTSGTGKNWLSPYVRLLSAVIPPSDMGSSVSSAERHSPKLARSSDVRANTSDAEAGQTRSINPNGGYAWPPQPLQSTRPPAQRPPAATPLQSAGPPPPPPPQQPAAAKPLRPTQRPSQLQQPSPLQPTPPASQQPAPLPTQTPAPTPAPAPAPAPLHSYHLTAFVPLTPAQCQHLALKHKGTFTPLVKPSTGSIFKKKSDGDLEAVAALAAARASVLAARPTQRPPPGTSQDAAGRLSVSNPKARDRNHSNAQQKGPPRLDVCSDIWQQPEPPPQRTSPDSDELDLFAFYSTLQVPEPPSTPMTPLVTEASVAETCELPPPYLDDRYDWLEILAAHGGLPGCVNATHLSEQHSAPPKVNDTCERPLNASFPGQELYTYVLSDLQSFYRDESAVLRFPGQSNQFVDVRGTLVWRAPPDDGNVYLVEYIVDDTGLWIEIPPNTCRFVDTMTLTCTSRLKCWCEGDKQTCLAQHGLPGNLYAALVGGG